MKKQIKGSHANRGITFEHWIDYTNSEYLVNDIAIIHKKPTPIQVLKMKYPENKIILGYFKKPSTTDYNGLYQGKYIDFEAKETKSKTSFPFSNIHEHQIKHLVSIYQHHGISFLLIYFSTFNEVFLLHTKVLMAKLELGKKSISYKDIQTFGHQIPLRENKFIDYLSVIYAFYWENE